MRINHNIAALNTYRQLGAANNAQSKSMEKLSSGLRINGAADDAAGLAISEKMRGQIRGLDMASKNAQDANSLIQTAEGALNETHDILQRMRELAVQAGNGTNTDTDREEIQKEINQMTSEINRIGNTTEFNTQKLLNGDKKDGKLASAASISGSDISGIYNSKLDKVGTIKVNGVDVVLTEVAKLDGSTTALTADDIKTALQTDLNAVFDGTKNNKVTFTVNVKGDSLTITSSVEGKDSKVDISGAGAATLGIAKSATGSDAGAGLQFQIGANENQSLTLEISDMRAKALGLTGSGTGFTTATDVTNGTDNIGVESALDVSTHDSAAHAVTVIQKAIDTVSAERSKLGATQNRLDHTINNLSTSSENLTAAESRIRDVDYALAA